LLSAVPIGNILKNCGLAQFYTGLQNLSNIFSHEIQINLRQPFFFLEKEKSVDDNLLRKVKRSYISIIFSSASPLNQREGERGNRESIDHKAGLKIPL
jgi:hypothetical protein